MAEWKVEHTLEVLCPNPRCPAPHKVVRNGRRGGDQQYRCRGCDRQFAAEGQAQYKQFTTKQIAAAVDKYYSGMSYKQVAEHMADFHDVPEPSKRSVHAWVKGYTKLARDFMDGKVGPDGTPDTRTGKPVKVAAGDHWVADELFLRVGGQQMYCWNVMDKDSRYILAVHLSRHRGVHDATKVMWKALQNAQKPPKKVTTDGLKSYVDAIKSVFPKSTEHVVSEGIRQEINNNISERLQGTFRSRTKTQRGLQMVRTGQDYLDGWTIDYNFFKPHHTLGGKTPAEHLGADKLVPWGDSWEDVTRMGAEVAKPNIKDEVITPRKTGPKPKPGSLEEAVALYQEQQAIKKAAAKIPKGHKVPPVAAYKSGKKPKPQAANKGRGHKGVKK